ncbi:lysosome membrane protein 2-like isoform X2 [Ornithodoros turicata]
MQLREGTETFEKWSNVQVPIYMSFYLFNITNPEEFMNGSKARLEQVGPFVYREYRKKDVQGFNNPRGTVQYYDRKSFVFEPAMSAGSEEDAVYVINVPLVAVAAMTRKHLPDMAAPLIMPILEAMMRKYNETLALRREVGEMLFRGYEVGMMKDLMRLAKAFLPNLDNPLRNNTFGLFYGKNNTNDGLYSVYTGVDDPQKFAKLEEWRNYKQLPYWTGPTCNMINGTDGGQFPPFVSKNATLYVFSTDLCRSIKFEYEKETEVRDLKAMRFTPPADLFAGPEILEENRCFCLTPENCPKSGVVHVSTCNKGAPIVLSSPHFYHGDNVYVYGVDGMHPSKTQHETFLDVHPMTGLVLRAAKRLQINVDLKKYERLQAFKDVEDTVFPVAWIEETAEVSPEFAEGFKQKVELPQQVGSGTIASAMVLGGIGTSICLIMIVAMYLQGKSRTAGISTEHLHTSKGA